MCSNLWEKGKRETYKKKIQKPVHCHYSNCQCKWELDNKCTCKMQMQVIWIYFATNGGTLCTPKKVNKSSLSRKGSGPSSAQRGPGHFAFSSDDPFTFFYRALIVGGLSAWVMFLQSPEINFSKGNWVFLRWKLIRRIFRGGQENFQYSICCWHPWQCWAKTFE